MRKLIDLFRSNPSDANRAKIKTYMAKHLMALCMCDTDEINFLKSHEIID